MKYCGQCGSELEPGSRFCGNCGIRLADLEESGDTRPAARQAPPVDDTPTLVRHELRPIGPTTPPPGTPATPPPPPGPPPGAPTTPPPATVPAGETRPAADEQPAGETPSAPAAPPVRPVVAVRDGRVVDGSAAEDEPAAEEAQGAQEQTPAPPPAADPAENETTQVRPALSVVPPLDESSAPSAGKGAGGTTRRRLPYVPPATTQPITPLGTEQPPAPAELPEDDTETTVLPRVRDERAADAPVPPAPDLPAPSEADRWTGDTVVRRPLYADEVGPLPSLADAAVSPASAQTAVTETAAQPELAASTVDTGTTPAVEEPEPAPGAGVWWLSFGVLCVFLLAVLVVGAVLLLA